MVNVSPENRYIRLITEKTVEHFLQRFFLRDMHIRSLCIVSPFINTMQNCRYTLQDLSLKVKKECIPTYVVTRPPRENYQHDAMAVLSDNEWVEIRFNESIHAKVYVSSALPESESFAMFGSGNLTGQSITSNIEVGVMIFAQGNGRPLVNELYYWANNKLRILQESRLHQRIRALRRKV
ncbi:MAG: hypothetical protein A2161_21360 [Candidatus Schekmanbacteria bacterium RBG_13_48_7]|uniref:Uncharacterized protein n=1 Tax=Candidatus Schekmanbacteria bacterium RBG_13_48_7 TaxID=1817878 RepID=A0A1F7RUG4_9BACT|nr:MAG: hypothetical protein A2161_21360 [Candidatus Schekmanbacteria bacterium RBG_13_48_7]